MLAADPELASLRTRDSLAEMAADAWAGLCRYDGHERLRETMGFSSDTRSFQRWARAFERRCREDGLLSQAQLEETLRQAAAEIELPQGGVALLGFDVMTPAQRKLLDALRGRGIDVVEIASATVTEQRWLCEAVDEREELNAAARWVRKILEQRSEARLAVIVPALEGERAEIDRVFREVLAPELEDIRAEGTGPYEFSLGVKLADVPMVATAFDLLRWVGGALPLEQVSRLLVSRYFAGARERGARARIRCVCAAAGRRCCSRRYRWRRCSRSSNGLLSERGWESCTRLCAGCGAWFSVGLQGRRAFMQSGAMQCGSCCRRRVGAREMVEDSVEFQARQRWASALDELATLDFDWRPRRVCRGTARTGAGLRGRRRLRPESREAPVASNGTAGGGRRELRRGMVPARGRSAVAAGCERQSPAAVDDAEGVGNARHRCGAGWRAGAARDGADCEERAGSGIQLCEGVGGWEPESIAAAQGDEAGACGDCEADSGCSPA